MGNGNSTNPEYIEALKVFNDTEKEQMKSLFQKLCHSGESLAKDQLQVSNVTWPTSDRAEGEHHLSDSILREARLTIFMFWFNRYSTN